MIPVARAEYTCSCGTDPRDCKSFGLKSVARLGSFSFIGCSKGLSSLLCHLVN